MYKIHTEGRDLNQVIKKGNTIRIDHSSFTFHGVTELNDWNYEVKKGHENGKNTIYYVTLINKKELTKYTGKRFVTKNSYNLGIENSMFDDEQNKYIPFWYIFDKGLNKTIEGYEDAGEGARKHLKKECDKLNAILN